MSRLIKNPYKKLILPADQRRLWEDTLSASSWIVPGFIHVLYTMLHNTGDNDVAWFTDEIPVEAATDGMQLIINPLPYFKRHLLERVFVLAHEVMHEIGNHVRMAYVFRRMRKIEVDGKSLPFDQMFSNFMQDFVINDILIESKIGRFNKDWLHDTKIASAKDSWLEAYFRNWSNRDRIMGRMKLPDGATDMQMPGRFDFHLDPGGSLGLDPLEEETRNQQAWELVVNAAREIQRGQGKLPAALNHFFEDVLQPKVRWQDHIRGLVVRIMGSGAYDWRRLDRRLIVRGLGAPGMSGHGAGLVIVGGDTSMSVFHDKTLVHRWLGELAGIMEDVQPEECHVVWCDTAVKRVDVCTDPQDIVKMAYKGVPGGGGTDFRPVFQYVADNDLRPDALIYLTDGDGSFPDKEPEYPVIWGDISGSPKEKYPFGQVVRVPVH